MQPERTLFDLTETESHVKLALDTTFTMSDWIPTVSRQAQEKIKHLRKVRRAKSSDRILLPRISNAQTSSIQRSSTYPSRHGVKTISATTRIATSSDVVQHLRVRIECGIDEAHRALARLDTLAIDESKKCSDGGGGATGSEDLGELAEDGYAEPGAVGGDVRESCLWFLFSTMVMLQCKG